MLLDILILLLFPVAVLLVFLGIPVLFGLVFLRWSLEKCKDIIVDTVVEVMIYAILSYIVTIFAILLGKIIGTDLTFAPGLMLLYFSVKTIRCVIDNIQLY